MKELKPQELRIWNWIIHEARNYTVQVDEGTFTYLRMNPNFYQPIPLTEEWLLKFGFKKDDSGVEPYHQDYCEWYEREFPVIGTLIQSSDKQYVFDENSDTLRIKYVHQLQNLYYALTGEELKPVDN